MLTSTFYKPLNLPLTPSIHIHDCTHYTNNRSDNNLTEPSSVTLAIKDDLEGVKRNGGSEGEVRGWKEERSDNCLP